MKKQYSKWALKALKLAEETARKCSHNYIGTEHILAGLLAVKDGTAGEILAEAGITQQKLLELMEKLVVLFQNDRWDNLRIYSQKQKGTC